MYVYMLTLSEQHLNIHKLEQFLETSDTLKTGPVPITLVSPIQLTYMLNQVKPAFQRTNPDFTLYFVRRITIMT